MAVPSDGGWPKSWPLKLRVYLERPPPAAEPDQLFSALYIALSPHHLLAQQLMRLKNNTHVYK